jgi:hypothetical protein
LDRLVELPVATIDQLRAQNCACLDPLGQDWLAELLVAHIDPLDLDLQAQRRQWQQLDPTRFDHLPPAAAGSLPLSAQQYYRPVSVPAVAPSLDKRAARRSAA